MAGIDQVSPVQARNCVSPEAAEACGKTMCWWYGTAHQYFPVPVAQDCWCGLLSICALIVRVLIVGVLIDQCHVAGSQLS